MNTEPFSYYYDSKKQLVVFTFNNNEIFTVKGTLDITIINVIIQAAKAGYAIGKFNVALSSNLNNLVNEIENV